MRSSTSVFAIWLVLLVLFASHGEMMRGAEGHRKKRVCQSLSHGFRGPCFHDHNCALVCRNEAFSGGRCHGFRRRCFCTKFCNPEEHPSGTGSTTTTAAMTTTKN